MSAEALIVPLQTLTAKARAALSGTIPPNGEADAILGHLQTLLEQRLAQIRLLTEQHGTAQRAWLEQQRDGRGEMARAEALIQILHQAQRQLHLCEPVPINVSAVTASVAPQWRSDRNESLLTALEEVLNSLPTPLLGKEMPFVRMQQQVDHWRQHPDSIQDLQPEALTSFQTMLERTVEHTLENRQKIHALHLERQNRLLALLPELLALERLEDLPEKTRNHLTMLTERSRLALDRYPIPLNDVEMIESSLKSTRQELDMHWASSAAEMWLGDVLTRHLTAMGYETMQSIRPIPATGYAEGSFRIPGGECVSALLHPDGKIGFQLRHEVREEGERSLTADEWAFYQQQEQIWCRDLHQLCQRLEADGVGCAIGFQREAHPDRIPMVMVEHPGEILAATSRQRPAQRTMN